MTTYRIAIAGGSIAGCTAAVILRRLGHDVQVFERSATPLVGHGASIYLPRTVFEMNRREGLVRDDIPRCRASRLRYVCKSARTFDETSLGTIDVEGYALGWSDLYDDLRANVSDEIFHYGSEVDDLHLLDDAAKVRVLDRTETSFDLTVFADGYRSFGRTRIDPEAVLAFDDVAMLRAIVPETPDDARFEGEVVRVLYPRGHGTFYFIPGPDGSTRIGRRRIACYLYYPASAPQPNTAPSGRLHRDATADPDDIDLHSSLPDEVHHIIERDLPRYFGELFHRTSVFHTQPIYSVKVSHHVRGRACLIGDAASVFPPYSTSGALKAVNNALSLGRALHAGSDLPGILRTWEEEQRAVDRKIAGDAYEYGKGLIYAVPDVANFGREEASDFLKRLHPGTDVNMR